MFGRLLMNSSRDVQKLNGEVLWIKMVNSCLGSFAWCYWFTTSWPKEKKWCKMVNLEKFYLLPTYISLGYQDNGICLLKIRSTLFWATKCTAFVFWKSHMEMKCDNVGDASPSISPFAWLAWKTLPFLSFSSLGWKNLTRAIHLKSLQFPGWKSSKTLKELQNGK